MTITAVDSDGTDGDIILSPEGGVGIGTNSPAYDLDVNGDIRAIGSVYYGGTVGNADGTAYNKPDYVFEDGYNVMKTEQCILSVPSCPLLSGYLFKVFFFHPR